MKFPATASTAFKARVDPSVDNVACGTCGFAEFVHKDVVYTEHTLASLAASGVFTPSTPRRRRVGVATSSSLRQLYSSSR